MMTASSKLWPSHFKTEERFISMCMVSVFVTTFNIFHIRNCFQLSVESNRWCFTIRLSLGLNISRLLLDQSDAKPKPANLVTWCFPARGTGCFEISLVRFIVVYVYVIGYLKTALLNVFGFEFAELPNWLDTKQIVRSAYSKKPN